MGHRVRERFDAGRRSCSGVGNAGKKGWCGAQGVCSWCRVQELEKSNAGGAAVDVRDGAQPSK